LRITLKSFRRTSALRARWYPTRGRRPCEGKYPFERVRFFRSGGTSLGMERGEQGFTILEAVVAVGLMAIGVGGVMAAMLMVLKPVGDEEHTAELAAAAENMITDLRAASGYDLSVLSGVDGQTRTTTVFEPVAYGTPIPLRATVTYKPVSVGGPVLVTVVVEDPANDVFQLRSLLINEAPHPGATLRPSVGCSAGGCP
jgi:type II secretory pathway pseudopilin PulG